MKGKEVFCFPLRLSSVFNILAENLLKLWLFGDFGMKLGYGKRLKHVELNMLKLWSLKYSRTRQLTYLSFCRFAQTS